MDRRKHITYNSVNLTQISWSLFNSRHPGPRRVWKVCSELQVQTSFPVDPVDPLDPRSEFHPLDPRMRISDSEDVGH